jgi:hypothetical protein
MPKGGHRHRLLLYGYVLNRWWRTILGIGLALLALAGGLGGLPLALPQYRFLWRPDWVLWLASVVGGLTVLAAIALIALRKSAYVQPFETYLRLATPFLRMNISYRRIRQTSTAEMGHIFPLANFKGRKRALLRPLIRETAIILDLNGWPMSPNVLRLFLSPFFFPDRTPRLALLVPDWMDFSTEMESFRGAWKSSLHEPGHMPEAAALSRLAGKGR